MPNILKLTEEKKRQYIELLGMGNTVTHAAEALGVSPATVTMHRHRDKAFNEAVKAALETRLELVADALYMSALGGNVTAQIFFLCNRTRHMKLDDPARWIHVNRVEVQHEGGVGHGLSETTEKIADNPELAAKIEALIKAAK